VRKHAGENLEAEIFLVAQAIGSALEDPDLVVEPLDETERDLVFRFGVGGTGVSVAVDHGDELLLVWQALPFECSPPVLEEALHEALSLIAPQLAEGFLEQVGGVQSPVGPPQRLERLAAFQRQVLPTRSTVYF
jgi:hypothetical protein